jgi:hypothetical protein
MTDVAVITNDKEASVEPSADDLADTVTANLRTMRLYGLRMDALEQAVTALSIVILFSVAMFAFVSVRSKRA